MACSEGLLFNGLVTKPGARLRESTRNGKARQGYQQLNPGPRLSVSKTQGGDVRWGRG